MEKREEKEEIKEGEKNERKEEIKEGKKEERREGLVQDWEGSRDIAEKRKKEREKGRFGAGLGRISGDWRKERERKK